MPLPYASAGSDPQGAPPPPYDVPHMWDATVEARVAGDVTTMYMWSEAVRDG